MARFTRFTAFFILHEPQIVELIRESTLHIEPVVYSFENRCKTSETCWIQATQDLRIYQSILPDLLQESQTQNLARKS